MEDNLKQIDDRLDFLEEYGLEVIEANSDENAEDDGMSERKAFKNDAIRNEGVTTESISSEASNLPPRRRQQLRDDNSLNRLGAFYSKSKKDTEKASQHSSSFTSQEQKLAL